MNIQKDIHTPACTYACVSKSSHTHAYIYIHTWTFLIMIIKRNRFAQKTHIWKYWTWEIPGHFCKKLLWKNSLKQKVLSATPRNSSYLNTISIFWHNAILIPFYSSLTSFELMWDTRGEQIGVTETT